MTLDPAQDLGAVDLAQDDLRHPHARHGERHSPAVAMKHREGVDVDVAIADPGVQAEGHGIDPDIAVSRLDTLGARGGAGRVVDGRRGVLVGLLPRHRLTARTQQAVVVIGTEYEPVGRLQITQLLVMLRVDDQHRGAAVADDVLDLRLLQPEVDRHEDPAVGSDSEEQLEHPGAVLTDDGDPLAAPDAQLVQTRSHSPATLGELEVGLTPQARSRLIGLVDDPDPVSVDLLSPAQEVDGGQRYAHAAQINAIPAPAARSSGLS